MLKAILAVSTVVVLAGCASSSLTSLRGPWCARPEPCGLTQATVASADTGADGKYTQPFLGHGRDGGLGVARTTR